MKRIIITTLAIIVFSQVVWGQTATRNYIKTRTYRQQYTTEPGYSRDRMMESVQYIDGLGRPDQTVLRQATPGYFDLVTPHAYDDLNREARTYLPYERAVASGSYDGSAITSQATFYNNTIAGKDGDSKAYAENVYEESALDRVSRQYGPGSAWNGNAVEYTYEFNTAADKVKVWNYSDLEGVTAGAMYSAGELFKNTVTDEDGNQTVEFITKLGQTILKKSQIGAAWAETYYIYDERQRLRVVLPPEANQKVVERLGQVENYDPVSSPTVINTPTSVNYVYTMDASVRLLDGAHLKGTVASSHIMPLEVLSPEWLAKWAFQYRYDGQNRMVMKQVPGADSVVMVYDQWDRLVLTQDGNQRQNSEWLFTKYDALNRPVMTGKKIISGTHQSIRDAVNASATRAETYGTGPLKGYTSATYPTNATEAELLTVTYYDHYDFVPSSDLTGTTYTQVYTGSGTYLMPTTQETRVRGQVTGTLVKGEGSDFLTTITYYDHKYRPIQVVSENHMGGTDVISTQYDFIGNVRKTQTAHTVDGVTTTVKRRMEYDHMDRLTDVYHEINTEGEVHILHNDYNPLGELLTKNLHDGEQEVDYHYNIRGWLRRINEADLTGSTDLFGMELYYHTNLLNATNKAYNGNISGMEWSDAAGAGSGNYRSYDFTYDQLNRLLGADHRTNGSNTPHFDVSNLQYDLNGNILTLNRNGSSGALIDQLDYHKDEYVGNQLMRVTDASSSSEGFDNGSSGTGNDYTYDESGNMKSDANKGITSITYDHLNLPTKVVLSPSGGGQGEANRIEYLYDAAGIKLRQKVFEEGTLVKTTDYVGEFIHETEGTGSGALSIIQHEEGRIIPLPAGHPGLDPGSSEGYDYQYHLKDHLGNVRLTFSTTPEIYPSTATYEDDKTQQESQFFGNLDPRVAHPAGGKGARLNNTTPAGTFVVLTINKGDRIDLSVDGYFNGGSGYSSAIAPATMEAALSTALNSAPALEGLTSAAIDNGIGAAITALGVGGSTQDNIPGAYINYLIFDREMNYQNIAGYTQIPGSANGTKQPMTIPTITADREGFLVAYISNESDSPNWVYFDDFSVTHEKTNVVSTQDYYPFGLTFNESVRVASTPNRFKYNSFELMDDLNLNLYDYLARQYDPAIGRFTSIDPLADFVPGINPYQYAFDNPVRYTDPDGMMPSDMVGSFNAGGDCTTGDCPEYPDGEGVVIPGKSDPIPVPPNIDPKPVPTPSPAPIDPPKKLPNQGKNNSSNSDPQTNGGSDEFTPRRWDSNPYGGLAEGDPGTWGLSLAYDLGTLGQHLWAVVSKSPDPNVVTGAPPDILGGPLRKGDKAIKIGKYLVNPRAWHGVKKGFLAKVGPNKFSHIVGSNPDIGFKGTRITLNASKNAPSKFRGKSFETDYSVIDFIKEFF